MNLPLSKILHGRENELRTLCQAHHVKYLFAFGSSVSANFSDNSSDIDLMVEIDETDPIEKGELLLDFYMALQDFFNRKVDLLTDQPIENAYLRENVESTKVLIYDREGEKVLV
ncbi:MAG: nucleotidyltransferase domain-containing protein [Bacteroidia bacterium]